MLLFVIAESAIGTTDSNTEVFRVLIGSLGGGGIAAYASYLIFRHLIGQIEKKDSIYEARINAIEKANIDCANDRVELHNKIYEIQKEALQKTNDALIRNSDMMNLIKEKLNQE